MQKIEEVISADIKSIGIAGHVSPDGDCIGSTTALYLYLKKEYPEKTIDLYLEEAKDSLKEIAGYADAKQIAKEDMVYDLFITCDVSEIDRIGVARNQFEASLHTLSIDHHETNPNFAEINHVIGHASSACEVLADFLDFKKLDAVIAENLYTGMVTDSGVFQFSSTSPHTMRIAADLMEFGFDHNALIDRVFNQRSFQENRILGYGLQKAVREYDGKIITSFITMEEMKRFGVDKKYLDLIVPQLRLTRGAEAAALIYEIEPDVYKVSLRSNHDTNVAEAAKVFGGGGHAKAAGCTIKGTPEEVFAKLIPVLKERIR